MLGWKHPLGITRPVHIAPLDPTAGKQRRVALRPVVAAGVVVDLRRATKLPNPHDERVVDQPPLLQVIQQHRKRLVCQRVMILVDDLIHPGVVEAVGVPAAGVDAAAADRLGEVDRRKSHARFHQPPGEQAALAVARWPVAIANLLWLGLQVEGRLHRRAREHANRLVVGGVEATDLRGSLKQPRLLIHHPQQLTPPLHPRQLKVGRQGQLRQMEALLGRVFGEEEGVVPLAEKARMLARRGGAVSNRVWIGNKGRHLAAAGLDGINNRSIRGPEVERVPQPLVVARRSMAGQGVVAGGVMVFHGVGHAVDQRDPVHPLGHLRKVLRHRQPRHDAWHRRQRPADLRRGIGLEIKGVEMARPAPLKQEDHPLGPHWQIDTSRHGSPRGGQLQPQQPRSPCRQQRPSAKRSLMKARTASVDVRHGNRLGSEGSAGEASGPDSAAVFSCERAVPWR